MPYEKGIWAGVCILPSPATLNLGSLSHGLWGRGLLATAHEAANLDIREDLCFIPFLLF